MVLHSSSLNKRKHQESIHLQASCAVRAPLLYCRKTKARPECTDTVELNYTEELGEDPDNKAMTEHFYAFMAKKNESMKRLREDNHNLQGKIEKLEDELTKERAKRKRLRDALKKRIQQDESSEEEVSSVAPGAVEDEGGHHTVTE